MDEERAEPDHQSEGASPAPTSLGPAPADQQQVGLSYDDVQRANRRRLALIGLGTGALMALIVLCCLLLLVLVLPE